MSEQSFMKSLFHGIIAEELVFPFPELAEGEHEQLSALLDHVRLLAKQSINSQQIDREQRMPDEAIRGLKELGLFGLLIPKEYGGLGLSTTAAARVTQEVGAIDASIAVMLGAHESIGLKGV